MQLCIGATNATGWHTATRFFVFLHRKDGAMKEPKRHYMGFRTTDQQAAKLSRIAGRAGVNTSEILPLVG